MLAADALTQLDLVDKGVKALQDSSGTLTGDAKVHLDNVLSCLTLASAQLRQAATKQVVLPSGASSQDRKSVTDCIDNAEKARQAASDSLRQAAALPDDKRAPAAAAISEATSSIVSAESAVKALRAACQTSGPLSSVRSQVLAIVIVGAMLVVVPMVAIHHTDGQIISLIFATVVMCLALIAVAVTSGEHGIAGPIIGADNRVSTSKTQFALWTVAVAFALAFLLARAIWDSTDLATVLGSDRMDQYLVLVGGPFAAGVLAKVAATVKTDNGTLQKSSADAPSASQVFSDDSGDASLIDSQYLIFNIVAMAYFIVRLAQSQVLPEMPDVLLGLTSASAATYIANKAIERNAPIVSAVWPRSCRPGQTIRVSGRNFTAGTERSDVGKLAVQISGYASTSLRPTLMSSENDLIVDLPRDVPGGTRELSVVTASGAVSDPYLIEVIVAKPTLLGLDGPAARGRTVRATGHDLLPPLTAKGKVNVSIGGFVKSCDTDGRTVEFEVPTALPANSDAALYVSNDVATSDPITVHVS